MFRSHRVSPQASENQKNFAILKKIVNNLSSDVKNPQKVVDMISRYQGSTFQNNSTAHGTSFN